MTTKRHDEHNPAEDTNHPVGETIPEITDRLLRAVQQYEDANFPPDGLHMSLMAARVGELYIALTRAHRQAGV